MAGVKWLSSSKVLYTISSWGCEKVKPTFETPSNDLFPSLRRRGAAESDAVWCEIAGRTLKTSRVHSRKRWLQICQSIPQTFDVLSPFQYAQFFVTQPSSTSALCFLRRSRNVECSFHSNRLFEHTASPSRLRFVCGKPRTGYR